MINLEGKTAIITGGTGGLGKDVVKLFLEKNCNVVSTYIIDDQIDKFVYLREEYKSKVIFAKADVTNENQIKKLIDKTKEIYGKIDFLINLVGGFTKDNIVKTELKSFDEMININLKSCFVCTKQVLPHFIENNSGKIVNIAAKPALKSYSGVGAYGASKAGVVALTESAADEVKDLDININAIIPGTIDTAQNRIDMKDADFSKWVNPEELAKIILFLVSEESKAISGAVIPALGKS